MSRRLLDVTEMLVAEGCKVPIDVAMTLMKSGYIVEGLEDRMIDGYQVIDDVVNYYEDMYE
jgi:hypothetical protein